METPNSSMRRVTRSQAAAAAAAAAAASNNKSIPISKLIDDSEQILSKSRQGKKQQESGTKLSALLDITNNSPIVGLAMGSLLTPSSAVTKKRSNRGKVMTPGSGEALLRGQVKTLLQKVEEEAELPKFSLEPRPIFPHLLGFVSSPMGLVLAPTPANTPQISNLFEDQTAKSALDLAVIPPPNEISEGEKHQESPESQKSLITRSLLLDFSEKSEISDASDCSSVLTHAGSGDHKEKSLTEEDNSSDWSIQVNASAGGEDFEEDAEEEEGVDVTEEDYDGEGKEESEWSLEELCSGLEKVSIVTAKFEGTHKRFVYNSDDEIVEEEGVGEMGEEGPFSPSIVRLKGLPTPKGKHLRFPLAE